MAVLVLGKNLNPSKLPGDSIRDLFIIVYLSPGLRSLTPYTPIFLNMDTKNDGFENVSRFKCGFILLGTCSTSPKGRSRGEKCQVFELHGNIDWDAESLLLLMEEILLTSRG